MSGETQELGPCDAAIGTGLMEMGGCFSYSFGWMKTIGNLRRFAHRGLEKVTGIFKLTAAAYNLVRMARLLRPA